MNKLYSFLLIFAMLTVGAYSMKAQTVKQYKKAAAEAYADNNYATALSIYKAILDEEESSLEEYYYGATSARKYRAYALSEIYYQKISESTERARFKETDYWLGIVQKRMAHDDITKYDEAIESFTKFITEHGNSDEPTIQPLVVQAEKEIEACEQSKNLMAKPLKGELKGYGPTVNTCYADFAPFMKDDVLYYSTFPKNAETGEPGFYSEIYNAPKDQNGTKLSSVSIQDKHAAHLTFNEAGNRVFYTICEGAPIVSVDCKIYYKDKQGDGWSQRIELPAAINTDGYTNTHPNVGKDDEGNDVLYFASDRPSGYGNAKVRNLDIWKAVISSTGEVTNVENLQFVNTDKDDMTPYYHHKSKTLYFSSNGRKSMGGYDLYKVKNRSTGWSDVKQLGYPINSSYDDFYITLDERGSIGYYTSNRSGSTQCGEEEEAGRRDDRHVFQYRYIITKDEETTTGANALSCSFCNDIYKVEMPQLEMKVLVYNKISGEPICGAAVEMLEGSTGDLDGDPAEDGCHGLDYIASFDDQYDVTASKEGYGMDNDKFDTFTEEGDSVIIKKLYLIPEIDLEVETCDEETQEPLNGVQVDLLKVIKVDAYGQKTEMDLSQEDPTSIMYKYPLEFGYEYVIVGTKDFYNSDTAVISTMDIPAEPNTFQRKLCLEKIEITVEIPPCNCTDLTHPVFNIPYGPAPKTTTILGRAPEYGDSHDLDATGFYNKLDGKYQYSAMERKFLDGIFKQMGYEGGWEDATPEIFSEVTVPRGVSGNLGTKVTHKTVYRKLDPIKERDLLAFRIKAKNGCDLHFMKTCGNHFFFNTCE